MKKLLSFLFFIGICVLHVQGQATDIYITDSGSSSGICTAGVQTPAFFNNAANWGTGAGQIGPGTTVHICGTFSHTAGTSALFSFKGSGTSGHPITLLADAGVNITSPQWAGGASPGPIYAANNNWIIIDGGTNGIIQNTANGTGLANETDSYGMNVVCSNCIIRNWTVNNICNLAITDSNGCDFIGGGTVGIAFGNGVPMSNVVVDNNTINGAYQCILYAPVNGDSNITIQNNTISHCNWGVAFSTTGGSITGVLIDSNDITCVIAAPCNWGGTTAHHNGIITFPANGTTENGVVISNNYIHDVNSYVSGSGTTAYVFIDPSGTGSIPGLLEYNNVLFTTSGQLGNANGDLGCPGNCIIVNNTFINPQFSALGGLTGPTFKNNVVSTSFRGIVLNSGYSGVTSDRNDFYNLTGGSLSMIAGFTSYATVSAWTTGTGLDTNSIITNPNLIGFALTSGSPAIGTGENLTSLGIPNLDIGAPQTFGAGGSCGAGCKTRPTSGGWDMGAFPFVSGGGSVSLNPTTLAFGTVVHGTTSPSMTIVVSNASGSTATFTGTTLSGANAGDFTKSGCSSGTLANSSTCIITLTFTPTATPIASETATLSVAYTGPSGSPLTTTLTGTSGSFTTPPAPCPQCFASATFLKLGNGPIVQQPPPPPILEQGNWQGAYGTDGYWLAMSMKKIPAYATVAVSQNQNWTWASNTSDMRGLLLSGTRLGACWYGSKFNYDVNFTDGKTHPFTMYLVDWDTTGRAETIQIVDATTGKILDTRKITNFNTGEYAQWNISGHVTVNVTCDAGLNAVVSGLFFN